MFPLIYTFYTYFAKHQHHNACLIVEHIIPQKPTKQQYRKHQKKVEKFERVSSLTKPVPDLTIENFSHDAMITDVVI